jgi:ATP-dependent DNA ligase
MIGDPTLPRTWRPQSFGKRAARQIDDPLVEPLWSGIRVLAHGTPREVDFLDIHGEAQAWPEVEAAVASSLQADVAVFDGYLTTEAASDGTGVVTGAGMAMPNAGQVARQLLMGGERSRRGELQDALEAAAPPTFEVGDVVVFVAVDLLLLDGEPLLDVPLLERKRLLEASLAEGPLVRRGMHVKPPIDVWISTWRSLGFRQMAFKQANSRYVPGEPNEDWATASIPRQ